MPSRLERRHHAARRLRDPRPARQRGQRHARPGLARRPALDAAERERVRRLRAGRAARRATAPAPAGRRARAAGSPRPPVAAVMPAPRAVLLTGKPPARRGARNAVRRSGPADRLAGVGDGQRQRAAADGGQQAAARDRRRVGPLGHEHVVARLLDGAGEVLAQRREHAARAVRAQRDRQLEHRCRTKRGDEHDRRRSSAPRRSRSRRRTSTGCSRRRWRAGSRCSRRAARSRPARAPAPGSPPGATRTAAGSPTTAWPARPGSPRARR